MKQYIAAIIIISILFCFTTTASAMDYKDYIQEIKENGLVSEEVVITECMTEESEQFLWNTLMYYLDGNEKIVAGIMGYFRRESGLKSNALQTWQQRNAIEKRDCCAWYTKEIDKGLEDSFTKEDFLNDDNKNLRRYGGYGLGQWFAQEYLDALYEFTKEWNTTIGDAEMQCAFIVWSLKYQRTPIWNDIKDEQNIYTIGRKIGYGYDGAGGDSAEIIMCYAVEYYNKYKQ